MTLRKLAVGQDSLQENIKLVVNILLHLGCLRTKLVVGNQIFASFQIQEVRMISQQGGGQPYLGNNCIVF